MHKHCFSRELTLLFCPSSNQWSCSLHSCLSIYWKLWRKLIESLLFPSTAQKHVFWTVKLTFDSMKLNSIMLCYYTFLWILSTSVHLRVPVDIQTKSQGIPSGRSWGIVFPESRREGWTEGQAGNIMPSPTVVTCKEHWHDEASLNRSLQPLVTVELNFGTAGLWANVSSLQCLQRQC